jgi:hypothetical protein
MNRTFRHTCIVIMLKMNRMIEEAGRKQIPVDVRGCDAARRWTI